MSPISTPSWILGKSTQGSRVDGPSEAPPRTCSRDLHFGESRGLRDVYEPFAETKPNQKPFAIILRRGKDAGPESAGLGRLYRILLTHHLGGHHLQIAHVPTVMNLIFGIGRGFFSPRNGLIFNFGVSIPLASSRLHWEDRGLQCDQHKLPPGLGGRSCFGLRLPAHSDFRMEPHRGPGDLEHECDSVGAGAWGLTPG